MKEKSKGSISNKINKINKDIKKNIMLIILAIIILITVAIVYNRWNYNIHYLKYLTDDGLSLLNEYELPWYLVEEYEEGSCMSPYDVGDGVYTFGPGVTYKDKQSGIDDINQRFDKNYTKENDCIDLEVLFDLQSEEMLIYETYVTNFLYTNRIIVEQNEFDALVLLAYNSPDFLKDEAVIEMLKSDPNKEEYIFAIDSYYQKLKAYYDNPDTKAQNDGYGEGWYNRIVDSAEIYFNEDYEYQNNV